MGSTNLSFPYPRHIVAASGLVQNAQGNVLLVYSPRRGWEMPGGQVEEGEDLRTALQREIMEESGIETKIGNLLAVYSNTAADPIPKLMFTFAATPISGSLQTTAETLDANWFSPVEALQKVTHLAQQLKLQDALDNKGLTYRIYKTNPFDLLETHQLANSQT